VVVMGFSSRTNFNVKEFCRGLVDAQHPRASQVKITRTTEAHKTKDERTLTQFTPAGGGRNLFVHNTDTDTLVRGIVERKLGRVVNGQLLPNIVPTREIKTTCRKALRRIHRRVGRATLMSRQNVVDCYTGPRKLLYEKAKERLDEGDLKRRHFFQKVFIKYEALDGTAKPIPKYKPRVICPRSYEASLEIGRVVKPVEHRIYRAVDRLYGGRTIVKGLNARERAEVVTECLESFRDPVVIPCDASHADSSVDDACRKVLHSIYRTVLGNLPLIDTIESHRCGKQWMFGESSTHTVRASGYFGLGSGDQDTSLVMNLLMGVLHWTMCDEVEVKCRAVIDGDDTLLVVEREDYGSVARVMQPFFESHGFSMVADPLVDPRVEAHKINHCKAFYTWKGDHYIMLRDLSQVLSKDLCTIQNISNAKDFDFFRKAKSDCGLAIAGDMPIYGAFYRMLGRGAATYTRKHTTGASYREKSWSRDLTNDGVVTAVKRIEIFKQYGITPDTQEALERHYDEMTPQYAPPTPGHTLGIDLAVEQIITGEAH